MTAYLSINERYLSLETMEFNIYDECYISSGIMHTRRENNGEIFVSSFASNRETFFVILSENIGSAK